MRLWNRLRRWIRRRQFEAGLAEEIRIHREMEHDYRAAGGRGRKAYAVTDAGRAELVPWLLEEPPTANRRNDLLLRLFFLGLVPPEQAQAFLHARAAAAADLPRKEPPPPAPPVGKAPIGKYPVGKAPIGKYPQPVVTKG